jgi:hypothetical protein
MLDTPLLTVTMATLTVLISVLLTSAIQFNLSLRKPLADLWRYYIKKLKKIYSDTPATKNTFPFNGFVTKLIFKGIEKDSDILISFEVLKPRFTIPYLSA